MKAVLICYLFNLTYLGAYQQLPAKTGVKVVIQIIQIMKLLGVYTEIKK